MPPAEPWWVRRHVYRVGDVVVLPHTAEDTPPDQYPGQTVLFFAAPKQRLGAKIIDIITVALGAVLLGWFGSMLPDGTASDILTGVLIGAWILLYEPLTTMRYGGALGKYLVGIRVVRASDPRRTPHAVALWRWVFYLLCVYPLGVIGVGLLDELWFLWDLPRRQCLHDKVSGTIVVMSKEP